MRTIIIWSCLAFQCFAVEPTETPGSGKDDSADETPPAAKIADYESAFEQLVQLGLPDARGASYVKLTLHGEAARRQQEMMMYSRHSARRSNFGATGNAWLLPGQTDGASTLISAGYDKITVVKKAKRGGLMRLLVGPGKEAAEGTQGDWTEEDVAASAKQILETLGTESSEGRMFDSRAWTYDDAGPRWCAAILVTACHMYRAGHQDEANRITDLLFSLAPEPILLVDQVVNDLAQREYQRLVDSFFETKDWQAYHDGTQKLITRFSRGWRSREGAKVLLARLAAQINGVKPTLTPLQGVVVNPAAAAIMNDWLIRQEPIQVDPPTCWLLGRELLAGNDEDEYGGGPGSREESNQAWMQEICAMGMDGFIALTSAATEDTLIPTRIFAGYRDYYDGGFGGGFQGRSATDSPGPAQYAAMTRPCSRGEIARTMILRTLPDPDNEFRSSTPEDLQATAYQWWRKHRGDSKSALARHFLEFGSSQQRSAALTALINSGDDGDAKVVEKLIMEAEDLTEQFSTVTKYLNAKRGKARPFFETFSKELKELVGDEGGEDGAFSNWQIREAGGVDKFLKQLSVYVDDVSPEKIVADMRNGTLGYKEGFPMLQTANGDKPISGHLPALVAVARLQKTPAEQYAVLLTLRSLSYYDSRGMDSEEDMKSHQESLPKLLAASMDDWGYFLDQDTPATDPDDFKGAPTLAAAAAGFVEMIYFPQHAEAVYELRQVMRPEDFWTFCLDRAEKLVNGEEVADFPSADAVDEERRKAIRETLKPMKAEEILKQYEGLSLNEQLAWGETLDGFGEEPPAGVAELSKRIVKIHWPPAHDGDDVWRKEFEARTLSKILDGSVVDGMINLMLEHAEHFQDLAIYLQSDGPEAHGIVISMAQGGSRRVEWSDRVLATGKQLLRDGKAKKIAGIQTSGADREQIVGLRFEPAQTETEAEYPIKAATDRIATTIDEGGRFFAVLAAETAENLKKREAEEGEEDPLLLLPDF